MEAKNSISENHLRVPNLGGLGPRKAKREARVLPTARSHRTRQGSPTRPRGETVGREEAGILAEEYAQIAGREGSGGARLLATAMPVGGPAVLNH